MAEGDSGKLHAVGEHFLSFRDEILGTLSLMAILILVYQGELVLADQLGHVTPAKMFEKQSVLVKQTVATLFGPFLHQEDTHIIENLGVLLLTGIYIEYAYGETPLVTFFFIGGYISIWLPVALGSVGSIGASGATYGLRSWMAIHALTRIGGYINTVSDDLGFLDDGGIAHVVPLVFGGLPSAKVITAGVTGQLTGAGAASHVFGALLGVFWGVQYATHGNLKHFLMSVSRIGRRILNVVTHYGHGLLSHVLRRVR